jgi:hypothetical protein
MPKRARVARYTVALDIDMYEANSQREVVCEFKYRKFAVRCTDRSPDKRRRRELSRGGEKPKGSSDEATASLLKLTSCVKRDLLRVERDLLCVKET